MRPSTPDAADRRGAALVGRIGEPLLDVGSRYALVLVGVIVVIIFSSTTQYFFTAANFSNIATSEAAVILLAVAATIPLKAGDFDLSVSAMMIDSAILIDLLAGEHGVNWILALLIVVALAAVMGLVNGFLVVDVGLDSFIVTLGAMTVLTGVGFGLSNNEIMFGVPQVILDINRRALVGNLPVACLYGWVIACVVGWIVGRTPVGRRLGVVGASREAAALLGLRVAAIRRTSYVCSAVIASLAGFVFVGVIGSVDPGSGSAYLLSPFAAIFLGATIGRLGQFNVLGSVLALYVLSITEQGLVLVGAPNWIADVFNGATLVAAMAFAKLWSTRANARTRAGAKEAVMVNHELEGMVRGEVDE